jgi:transketolase
MNAFNLRVFETPGHDMQSLVETLNQAKMASETGPVVVIADTVKGKGVSFMENNYEWHGKAPDDSQLEAALAELEGEG